ncbi:hypothetical protein HBB16_11930 [Pseudonocardia sp. MCCB 268]|nr:hypothetical protein [Pseudonocardia cytotoxica]
MLRQTGDTGGPCRTARSRTATVGPGPRVRLRLRPRTTGTSARRYLAAPAANWDDGASLTVLSERFDTVFAPRSATRADRAVVRVRDTRSPAPGRQRSRGVQKRDGTRARRGRHRCGQQDDHWQSRAAPAGDGAALRLRANYRSVGRGSIDPARERADGRHPLHPSTRQRIRCRATDACYCADRRGAGGRG